MVHAIISWSLNNRLIVILGVVALVVLSALPFIGAFVFLAALVVGLGAFYLEAAERY